MTPVARLRAATSPSHEMVDAAFGGHDLATADDYARFLMAHALALPAVERRLAGEADLPAWRERTTLLAADLADLGHAVPPPLTFTLPDRPGASWGVLYVTEGSRLGGIMLSRSVAAELPSRYLAAKHQSGEWRALLTAIDQAGEAEGDAWVDSAIDGALACFALYRQAADRIGTPAP
jgi:heme oxygenase